MAGMAQSSHYVAAGPTALLEVLFPGLRLIVAFLNIEAVRRPSIMPGTIIDGAL